MSNKARIVVMGCGGSGGVPYSGNFWGKCDPKNPKNHRTRPSILIEKNDTRIVIDTGPEFRQQINAAGVIGMIDAVFYTHTHFDHVMGIDDLRAFWFKGGKKPIPAYASQETADILLKRFDYIFSQLSEKYPPMAVMNLLQSPTIIKDLTIHSFDQGHHDITTTGFRIGDFAYSTDVKELPEASLKALQGVKIWVVGAYPDAEGQYNHAGLDQVNQWIARLKPEMTYLTHLNAAADYDTLCRELPPHIRPAYDGLEIII